MKNITRSKIMFQGLLKKGDRSILTVGEKEYKIPEILTKKIRLKNFLLGSETLILSLIYLFSMERFDEIPFKGADPELVKEGLMMTFLFLGMVAVAFYLTSILLLPEDIHLQLEEIDEDF